MFNLFEDQPHDDSYLFAVVGGGCHLLRRLRYSCRNRLTSYTLAHPSPLPPSSSSQRRAADAMQAKLTAQSAEITRRGDEARAELAEAVPAVEEAAAAVRQISKSQIDEIRNFRQPPAGRDPRTGRWAWGSARLCWAGVARRTAKR